MTRPQYGDKVVFQVPVYGVGYYYGNGRVAPLHYVDYEGAPFPTVILRSTSEGVGAGTPVYEVGEENIERMPDNGN